MKDNLNMTILSVNLNKIALLRNSRGRDYPNVVSFAQYCIDLGAKGITVHPRADERHITSQDVFNLSELLSKYDDIEFNVEGAPTHEFIQLIEKTRPDQVTLVPDGPDQLTSDHGFDLTHRHDDLLKTLDKLRSLDSRIALFMDPEIEQITRASQLPIDRIELYTERYASSYSDSIEHQKIFNSYATAAQHAQKLGLGVNAGHDLSLTNLAHFLTIPNILEVSIGHALIVESLEQGMPNVISQYLDICNAATQLK